MPTTVTDTTLAALIDHIVATHHNYLRCELPFLEERIGRMCRNHGQQIPSFFAIQQLLQDLRDDLIPHLEKEELVLFPYLRGLETARETGGERPHACFPSVQFPIRVMLMEHDSAQATLRNLRSTTANYSVPQGLCENAAEFYRRLEGLEADLQEHIRVENEVLFPRALQLEQ